MPIPSAGSNLSPESSIGEWMDYEKCSILKNKTHFHLVVSHHRGGNTTMIYKQESGEYGEGGGFSFRDSTSFSYLSPEDICKHCKVSNERVEKYGNRERIEVSGISPVLIVARNEGGHSSTGVCLLCVLEAAKKLGIKA